MVDCLRTGMPKSSQYIANHYGQLILPSVSGRWITGLLVWALRRGKFTCVGWHDNKHCVIKYGTWRAVALRRVSFNSSSICLFSVLLQIQFDYHSNAKQMRKKQNLASYANTNTIAQTVKINHKHKTNINA